MVADSLPLDETALLKHGANNHVFDWEEKCVSTEDRCTFTGRPAYRSSEYVVLIACPIMVRKNEQVVRFEKLG